MKIFKNNSLLAITISLLFVTSLQYCSDKKKDLKKIKNQTNNYAQIATGQISTYGEDGQVIETLKQGDTLFGQDANYLKGKKMSYQKSDNGVTTDLNSGLMWQEIPTSEGFDWQYA